MNLTKHRLKLLITSVKCGTNQDYLDGIIAGAYIYGSFIKSLEDRNYLRDKYVYKLPAVRVRPCAGKVGDHTTAFTAPDTFSLDDEKPIVQDQPKHGENRTAIWPGVLSL